MTYLKPEQMHFIKEIKQIHSSKKEEIKARLAEFKEMWRHGTREEIFQELAFCIITPMARGKYCWHAIENMTKKDVLFHGDSSLISTYLKGARFINKKSMYIVEARDKFYFNRGISIKDSIANIGHGFDAREWLVLNVKGIGYKEASHFLRNIGSDQGLAILDRHILKNLKLTGVIKEIPDSLTGRKYLCIEKNMKEFSKKIKIPMSHLDLVMWCKETGEIFK
jgi:N-glycosylase/DNA lyase